MPGPIDTARRLDDMPLHVIAECATTVFKSVGAPAEDYGITVSEDNKMLLIHTKAWEIQLYPEQLQRDGKSMSRMPARLRFRGDITPASLQMVSMVNTFMPEDRYREQHATRR